MSIKHKKKRRTLRSKFKFYHYYLKRHGFYSFVYRNIVKLIVALGLLFLMIFFLKNYFSNIESVLDLFFQRVNVTLVLALFFVSESILGLIPPDLFIIWGMGFHKPAIIVTALAILSYIGGVVSYFIGRGLGRTPKVEAFVMRKFIHHFDLVKKWGGIMVAVGALLPLPYAVMCLAVGVVRYPLKTFLLLGLLRILRIYLYAYFIYHALDIS